ncbi:hypothetical protein [Rhodococcus sp. SBT000017]|uniref:hypothetical protein n=1 Tax=unclassified Rhodococcus (in: high G+C Gram-positive bacteria) TaxID=192944 RepID=UPI000EF90D90|nr:hypothetical protein [Rhodococcus sp. SBT000017]MDZ7931625.1 hypothetical protein [Rhodococcus sp. (in: high G+C Gram-positive bacteria)]RMB77288.1 hypothetical protein AYK61_13155 [Rhodococcus sp. SBT000017]
MELQPRLLDDLATLTESLDNSTVDLARLARQLAADIDVAVSAVVSITLTLIVDGERFDVSIATSRPHQGVVASSLEFTLAGLPDSPSARQLLILSGTAGALVDFAADVGFALGLSEGSAVLDRHLVRSGGTDFVPADPRLLADVSEVNQAIGVLVASGRTVAEARTELGRLAERSNRSTVAEAGRTLRDARGWFPPRLP